MYLIGSSLFGKSSNNSRFTRFYHNSIQDKFSSYLAGLIEGNSCIITPKELREIKGRKKYPAIKISFNSKDFTLALMSQKHIKFGSLSE